MDALLQEPHLQVQPSSASLRVAAPSVSSPHCDLSLLFPFLSFALGLSSQNPLISHFPLQYYFLPALPEKLPAEEGTDQRPRLPSRHCLGAEQKFCRPAPPPPSRTPAPTLPHYLILLSFDCIKKNDYIPPVASIRSGSDN